MQLRTGLQVTGVLHPLWFKGFKTLFGNHNDENLKKCYGGLPSEKHTHRTFHTTSLGFWTTWA